MNVDFINRIREQVEPQAFGVCTMLAEKLRISKNHIRLFFIYSSFVANFSPIIIYLIIAFWMNIKNYIKEQKSRVWE